ncbi:hypothetical protein PZA11_005543 [Diplocarpon coronariae]
MHITFPIFVVLLSVFHRALSKPRSLDLLIRISEDTFPEKQAEKHTHENYHLGPKDDESHLIPSSKSATTGIRASNFLFSTDNPNHSDIAELPASRILFFDDFNFQGDEKGYQVLGHKCYNLSTNSRHRVLSARLEDRIWYCSFFATMDCEGDVFSTLGGGEYENLTPEDLNLASFSCELYEGRDDALSLMAEGVEAEGKVDIISIIEVNIPLRLIVFYIITIDIPFLLYLSDIDRLSI